MYLLMPFIPYYILASGIELQSCLSLYKILILYFKIEIQMILIVELIFLIGLGLN
jgi:hypothetical protein